MEPAARSPAPQDPAEFGIGNLFWLTNEAIVAADLAQGTIVLWNPSAERIFGYSAHEALGSPLELLVPAELRDQHLAGLRRYTDTGEAVLVGGHPIDVPGLRKDGSIVEVALTLTDVSPSGRRSHVIAIVRDVSDIRAAARDLERATTAMREFVATASHDLRTPLTSVLGFANALRDDVVSDEERREWADAILRNARRASRLVDDLLTLSQIEASMVATTPERLRVHEIVASIVRNHSYEVVVDVDPALEVSVDGDHLERMLVNYVDNALRYGAPPVRVTAARSSAGVVIEVCDAGGGVPEEFRDRLFTSFARADPSTPGGTGLGLSIVRGLAESNDGRAYYRQTATTSCFGVELPEPA